jgi:hypothetical protein
MKIRNGKLSGTVSNSDMVYVNSPDGQIVRSRPHRPWQATMARLDHQAILARVAGQ